MKILLSVHFKVCPYAIQKKYYHDLPVHFEDQLGGINNILQILKIVLRKIFYNL